MPCIVLSALWIFSLIFIEIGDIGAAIFTLQIRELRYKELPGSLPWSQTSKWRSSFEPWQSGSRTLSLGA